MRLSLFVLCCLWAIPACAAEPLVGAYTHGYVAPGESPVWEIIHDGNGYQARTLADDEHAAAWLLSGNGRTSFWEKMAWPAEGSTTAICLSWGTAPPTLQSLLEPETKAGQSREAQYGASVLCKVQPADKAKVDWLANYQSDYFYYDPLFGVVEIRALP